VFNIQAPQENRMNRFAWAKALLIGLVTLAAGGAARGEAIPAADAQKAAEIFQSLYGDEMRHAQDTPATTDDVTLAAKLLEAVQSAKGQPALLAVLCEKAAQLGLADAKGYETALAAAQLLASAVPEKAAACQETILAVREQQYKQAPAADKVRAGDVYVGQLLATAALKAAAGDIDKALERARQAAAVARLVKSSSADDADALIKHYTALQKVAADLPRLKAAVAAKPDDTAVREQLVRLLLIELDSPAEAAKYLSESCDEKLRKYVPAAGKDVEAAPEVAAMELGNWYYGLKDVAQTPAGKRAVYTRAAAYYRRFLEVNTTGGMDRTLAELAIKNADAEIAKLGGAAGGQAWTDLLKRVDLNRDAPNGKVVKAADGLAFSASSQTRLNLPVIPAGDYEIEVRFTRTANKESVCMVLPVAGRNVTLMLGADHDQYCCLDQINGKGYNQNETSIKSGLQTGHLYTLVVRVSTVGAKSSIQVALDGRAFINWNGLTAALSPMPLWTPLDPRSPTFGGWNIGLTLHSARIKMLTGKATYPAPTAAEPATKPR
jgi:hypothetical protein